MPSPLSLPRLQGRQWGWRGQWPCRPRARPETTTSACKHRWPVVHFVATTHHPIVHPLPNSERAVGGPCINSPRSSEAHPPFGLPRILLGEVADSSGAARGEMTRQGPEGAAVRNLLTQKVPKRPRLAFLRLHVSTRAAAYVQISSQSAASSLQALHSPLSVCARCPPDAIRSIDVINKQLYRCNRALSSDAAASAC